MEHEKHYLNLNLRGGRIVKIGGITASLAPLALAVSLLVGSGSLMAQAQVRSLMALAGWPQ